MGTIHLFSTRFRSALKEFNAAVKIRSKVLAHDHIDVFVSPFTSQSLVINELLSNHV